MKKTKKKSQSKKSLWDAKPGDGSPLNGLKKNNLTDEQIEKNIKKSLDQEKDRIRAFTPYSKDKQLGRKTKK